MAMASNHRTSIPSTTTRCGPSGPRILNQLATITATLAGTYWVTATLANCQAADTIVLALASVPAVDLGPTQLLCQGDSLTLDATADGASYLWEDGSAAATRLITEAGTYWVQVSHACGVLTDQVKVEVSDCNCYIYFPNVFSPNGDGFNDAFAPFPSCPYEAYRLQVFDRWGALVFDNSDPAAAWDGSIKGKAASLGVYVYLATFRFAKDPAPQLRSGALNLVR